MSPCLGTNTLDGQNLTLSTRIIPVGFRSDEKETPYMMLWKHSAVKVEE
jgi:hypothetical protein